MVDNAPSLASQLRYIGRDGSTGQPVRVDDRFIAAVEKDFEEYGKVERQAYPPPPLGDDDITRLLIPAIGVDAAVARYGIDLYGRLDVPADAATVGWHPAYSDIPGTNGATFMAAHVSWAGRPGVFSKLNLLPEGSGVTIGLASGKSVAYRVTAVFDYPLETLDMGALLTGREGVESLTLMTCSGRPDEGEFPLRTVALAVAADG
jgi:sortase (surface protein transpeptidase)